MNEAERIAHAEGAKRAYTTYVEPMFDRLKEEYAYRIVEVATTVLNPRERADMLTALSNAHKIAATLDSGMKTMIADADLAIPAKLRAEKVERMSPTQRRLFKISPF